MSKQAWAGRIITGLAAMFMAFSGGIKFSGAAEVTESFVHLGYSPSLAYAIGTLELGCLVLCLIPRTAVLGAIAMTGYLGGAVATHLRVGDPWPTHVLFPIYIGAMIWIGIYLREPRLRPLVPLR